MLYDYLFPSLMCFSFDMRVKCVVLSMHRLVSLVACSKCKKRVSDQTLILENCMSSNELE